VGLGQRVGGSGSAGSGLGVVEPVALTLRFDDSTAMCEAIEGSAGESFGSQDFSPRFERQVGRDDQAGAFVGGGDDIEEQFGTDFGRRHVAELVEDEQVELRELGLEPQEGAFVSGFDEGGDEFGGSEEPDFVALVACGDCERGREMALAGAGVADQQDVSRLSMNSQRASSVTSILLTDGRAVKSNVSSVLMVGNRAALSRRSAARFSRSNNSSSVSCRR
jgi:hypothetical protein